MDSQKEASPPWPRRLGWVEHRELETQIGQRVVLGIEELHVVIFGS